jgi:hypothetical protein
MESFKHDAERIMERRGPYEAFAVILTFALFVGSEWIAATLVGVFLVGVAFRSPRRAASQPDR